MERPICRAVRVLLIEGIAFVEVIVTVGEIVTVGVMEVEVVLLY